MFGCEEIDAFIYVYLCVHRYQPGRGDYLVSASYDNTARVWSNKTWQPLNTLSGHDNKVMGLDISPDSKYIVTSSYDRTFKLWTPE